MLITSEIPFASSASAAISTSHTKCPVATMTQVRSSATLLLYLNDEMARQGREEGQGPKTK
jgi:hypothetical protein